VSRPSEVLRILVAHPSPDLYGSDRQLLESVDGMTRAGYAVTVCLPADGPLVPLLEAAGARVQVVGFPVLRRAVLRPIALLRFLLQSVVALVRLVALTRRVAPHVVYVNTVTMPVWLLAARLARRPVLAHVHEAEEDAPRLIRVGLAAPLLLAHRVVGNSATSIRALTDVIGRLGAHSVVVPNGVRARTAALPEAGVRTGPARVALVGRLSPRKGTDVALEAVARLRAQGRDVVIDLCGTVFTGYEWFEDELRVRAARPDLAGAVEFLGYVDPTEPVLARAAVVLVPSRVEPFGNTAVEGLLAGRPVVASDTQGLAEIIDSGRTGVLVPPDDADALAEAVGQLLDDPAAAERLAAAGRADALQRFGVERYQQRINAVLQDLAAAD
jgi:glycosyltransferase involved in cell wall biosynthesis